MFFKEAEEFIHWGKYCSHFSLDKLYKYLYLCHLLVTKHLITWRIIDLSLMGDKIKCFKSKRYITYGSLKVCKIGYRKDIANAHIYIKRATCESKTLSSNMLLTHSNTLCWNAHWHWCIEQWTHRYIFWKPDGSQKVTAYVFRTLLYSEKKLQSNKKALATIVAVKKIHGMVYKGQLILVT